MIRASDSIGRKMSESELDSAAMDIFRYIVFRYKELDKAKKMSPRLVDETKRSLKDLPPNTEALICCGFLAIFSYTSSH